MTDVRREGFSLMEVILAMSILLGGVIVLAQLARLGGQHARNAEDLATAQLLCEARLTEILAGISPLEELEAEPLEDSLNWVVTQELLPLEQPGVVALRVTITRSDEELTSVAPTTEETAGKKVSVTLVRWVTDPNAISSRDTAPSTDFNSSPATSGVEP